MSVQSTLTKAFAEYYKAERNRDANCLADIVTILGRDDCTIDMIITRLIKHYDRKAEK
jgi:hypothetical protein